MNIRPLASAAAVAALGLALAGCGSSDDSSGSGSGDELPLVTAGTLTVCSDVPYPPFEDFDKGSEIGFTGYDIEIVQKIAEGLELDLAIKDSSFDALQSGLALNSGQCDMAASAMTITEDRDKNLDFTQGYYDSKQSLLVPTGSDIASIDDLAGKTVGVQQGTTGKKYAEENAGDAELLSFPSDGEMYAALQAGQVDALLQDLPVNLDHENDPKHQGEFEVVETYDTGEQYGFALKTDSPLVDEVDEQLDAMEEDGSLEKIYTKYFGDN